MAAQKAYMNDSIIVVTPMLQSPSDFRDKMSLLCHLGFVNMERRFARIIISPIYRNVIRCTCFTMISQLKAEGFTRDQIEELVKGKEAGIDVTVNGK